MWPNLLSLDAPLVAIVWQLFLARTFTPVAPAATAVLGLSVWLVYVTDRLLDTRGGLRPRTPRHEFIHTQRRPLLVLCALVLVLDVAIALTLLPAAQLAAGWLLLGAVGLRALLVLAGGRPAWVKTLFTALIFAAGVWMPVLLEDTDRPGVILFALLCWWNCAAIDQWESGRPGGLASTAALLAGAALVFYLQTWRPVALAGSVAAGGFLVLALGGARLSLNLRRVAVDACLLAPLLIHGR